MVKLLGSSEKMEFKRNKNDGKKNYFRENIKIHLKKRCHKELKQKPKIVLFYRLCFWFVFGAVIKN